MATVKVMLHKSWQHKDSTYPVVLQIIHNRKKRVIYTGYNVQERDFNAVLQKVCCDTPGSLSSREVQRINLSINKKRKAVLNSIAHYETRGEPFTVYDLSDISVHRYDVWFLEYMDKQIATKRANGHEGIAIAYQSTRSSFGRFLKEKDIPVSRLTASLLDLYDSFLRRDELSPNTISYYMRNLKTIYNRAVYDGFKANRESPFKRIKTGVGKTIKRAISREALIRIATLTFDPKKAHLELARDIFMFGFYCRGMSFVDIIRLKKSHIVTGIIFYSRQKSRQAIRITITPQLQELIDKYRNDTEYVFPVLDVKEPQPLYRQYKLALQRVTYALKPIGRLAGLEYSLTTSIARHTWATQAKNIGISVSVISEGLGHTSEKTTRIYLKEFDTSILDNVNEQVTNLEI